MTASELAVSLGCESLKQVSEVSGIPYPTLTRWAKSKPQALKTICIGVNKNMENKENNSGWISVNDRLPDDDFTYCLAVRHHHSNPESSTVQHTFFTKDRDLARNSNDCYSREYQGKLSVHFRCAEAGFVVTHWMPLPEPPKSK